MGTKQENAAKRVATVKSMGAQLQTWANRLDELVAGYLNAGANSNDAYRLRIDELRERHGIVQAKYDEYTDPSDHTGGWGAFREGIKSDWKVLKAGFADLTS